MYVNTITVFNGSDCERLQLFAVPGGTPEDNTFADSTPAAEMTITISNPTLIGKIKPGQKFYVDFIEAGSNC